MNSKVYITQDLGRTNFTLAEDYGELISVIEGYVSPTGLKRFAGNMQDVLRDITKDDYLLLAGHPTLTALAGHIMARRTGVIRTLTWDRQLQRYLVSELKVM